MKKRFRKISHGALAMVLTLCMLVACLNVGMITANADINAHGNGSNSWHVKLKDNTNYYNAYNVDIKFDVTSARLNGNDLLIYVYEDGVRSYGNNESIGSIGGSTNLNSGGTGPCLIRNASNYKDITIKVTWTGTATVTWVAGTPKTITYTTTAGVVDWQSSYGSASVSSASVSEGAVAAFTASPNSGYSFVGWYSDNSGNTLVSTNNPYEPTINANTTLYAKFASGPYLAKGSETNGTFTLSNGGTTYDTFPVTSGIAANDIITVTCSPASGYEVASVTAGSQTVTKTSDTVYTFTMPNGPVTVNVTFARNTFYTVTFAAGPHGSVTATADGSPITSGKMVRYGTNVVITAKPNSSDFEVASWTGTNGGSSISNETSTTYTVGSVQGDIDAKVWFKEVVDEGTPISLYFRCNTNKYYSNQSGWTSTFSATPIKVKNGRMYAYIDDPASDTTYYFTLSDGSDNIYPDNSINEDHHLNESGVWTYDKSSLQTVTDFSGYVAVGQDQLYRSYGSGNDKKAHSYLGTAAVKSGANVSKLIIDLGKYENGSPSLDNDTFKVIPVYDTDSTNIDVYAKNGSYRGDEKYDYYNLVGKTTITSIKDSSNNEKLSSSNYKNHTNFATAAVNRGDTITVQTKINDASDDNLNYRDTYYVKGFSVNGVTPALYEPRNDNTYTLTYTVPNDFKYDYLEITPIYYFKSSVPGLKTVNFFIENYDKNVQTAGWGNTLSVYPYYFVSGKDDLNNQDNAFGGYPGQPVINYGGNRYIQIPTSYILKRANRADTNYNHNYASVGNTATIKGITLSNDYWDVVHRDYVKEVDSHLQTYDYDDFYKIFYETNGGHEVNYVANPADYESRGKVADQITFRYKFREKIDNFVNTRITNSGTMPDSISISDYNDINGNGWDNYLDYYNREISIFGRILSDEEKANTPLYVVSNGYEYTYAGYYATTWTVYSDNGDGTAAKIGTITPSALEISDVSRLNNQSIYPDSSGRGDGYPTLYQLRDFTDTYNSLKNNYSDRPVYITYEKNLTSFTGDYKTTWSEDSIRSDGVWLYSYYKDEITANIRIEYKNDENSATWIEDDFRSGTNTGAETGASAYFAGNVNTETNAHVADINGKHTTEGVKVYSTINETFKFTATQPGGYIFDGWWLEKDGIATRITENDVFNGESAMISNATFVARYVKSPSGTLTINHTVDDTNSTGAGTTYVAVKAIASDNTETWLTGEGTEADHFTANQYEIGTNYISYRSGYTFEITLKTVPDEYSSLTNFREDTANGKIYWDPENTFTPASGVTETKFTISVDDLFSLDENNFPQQDFNILSYYSKLDVNEYKYVFTYKYDAFVETYGELGYTVRGTFDHDDLTEYMQINTDTGALEFKNNAAQVAFLNLVAPYEDNFMKTISWNTADVIPTYEADANDAETPGAALRATITDTQTDTNINLTFVFPYQTLEEDQKFKPVSTNGVIQTAPDEVSVDVKLHKPKYGEIYSFNGVTANFGETPDLLAAPSMIHDAETNKDLYFRYWKVSTYSEKHSLVEYTRCYNTVFDYVLYQDSIVEPFYSALEENEAAPTPQSELDNDEKGVTITFIENSRNQFNENQFENTAGVTISTVRGDRVYSNFLLSMNNAAKLDGGAEVQLNTLPKNTMKSGVVVERVDELGEEGVLNDTEYKTLYGSTLDPQDANAITGAADKEAAIKDFIQGKGSGFLKAEFDVTELNNKNRINYYYSLPNSDNTDPTLAKPTIYRRQVYRAYAYLCDADHTNIVVSAEPVYFTIYDIGSIDHYTAPTGGED